MRYPVALGVSAFCAFFGLAGRDALPAQAATAAASEERPQELVTVSLRDGSVIIGRIVSEDDTQVIVLTGSGAEARIPRAAIERIERRALTRGAGEPVPRSGRFTRDDPNGTRLMFAPTGRPLGRGEGQFSDYYVLFPGFSYGLTDNVSLLGGVSVIPGLGLDEQALYVAPRVAFAASKKTSLSAGVLFATAGSDTDRVGAGIAFGVGTFGSRQASLTAGLGFGFVTTEGEFERADRPIVMLGGELQLSDSAALISENWLILGEVEWDQQPFGLALRLFGERLSVDVGVILVGEVLKEGFPVPWVSFSYGFGRGAGRT